MNDQSLEQFETRLRGIGLMPTRHDRDQTLFACGQAAALAEAESNHKAKATGLRWGGIVSALAASFLLGGFVGHRYPAGHEMDSPATAELQANSINQDQPIYWLVTSHTANGMDSPQRQSAKNMISVGSRLPLDSQSIDNANPDDSMRDKSSESLEVPNANQTPRGLRAGSTGLEI